MNALNRWLLALAGTAVATVAAYLWLDRPIALFSHAHISNPDMFAVATHIPDPFMPAAVIVFAAVGIWVLSGRALAKPQLTALLCSISLIVAETTKNQLKYIFGRTWPDTWVNNNPSFIHDGVFGFNFMHGGIGYTSFPSGHSTLTCSLLSVLWIAYPKFWPLYLLVYLAVVIGLLGADFHWLSDIIAGTFLGISYGWMTVALWRTRAAL